METKYKIKTSFLDDFKKFENARDILMDTFDVEDLKSHDTITGKLFDIYLEYGESSFTETQLRVLRLDTSKEVLDNLERI